MSKTVLLTGAGGVALPGLVAHLQEQGFHVLTADMDPHAPGLFFSDGGFVIPAAIDSGFAPELRRLCEAHGVDVLVPLVDEELVKAVELESESLKVLCPRRSFVDLCLDKQALCDRLVALGLGGIQTRSLAEVDRPAFPCVIKPRRGRGSRGLGIIHNAEQFTRYRDETPYEEAALMVQPYIDGPEYTTSVVTWREGRVFTVVPKRIILKRGVTRLARTERNETIIELGRRLQAELRADGPFNVQLRIDKKTGQPYVFEINPRFSTSMSLTIAAGADELGGLVEHATDPSFIPELDGWRPDVVLVRSGRDVFMTASEFAALQPEVFGA